MKFYILFCPQMYVEHYTANLYQLSDNFVTQVPENQGSTR